MDLAKRADYFLDPGYVYFSKRASAVRTVVGSCVAVCIWDKNLRYGGMNHFLWPSILEAAKATPKYGNVAMVALLRMMEEAGCQRHDLVAQIMGGGIQEGASDDPIGPQNVKVAREVLSRKGIQIIAEDTGGTVGRKIFFDTGTGELAVLKVHKIRASDWHG